MDEPLLPSEAASAAMAASDVESSGAEGPTQPRVASRGVERRASMSGYEMDYEIEEEFFADADKRVGEPRPASGYSSEQLPERPRLPPSYRHPMLNASPKYPSDPLKKQPRRQRESHTTPILPICHAAIFPHISADVLSQRCESHTTPILPICHAAIFPHISADVLSQRCESHTTPILPICHAAIFPIHHTP